MLTKLRIRRARAAVLASLVLAACSENGGGITTPPQTPPATPPNTIATIACTADVRAGTLACSDASTGVRADRILGGQGVNVQIQSSNVSYNAADSIFSADVTVKNLLPQRMGSDGASVTGVKVFFHSGPNVTSGSGLAEVHNADGLDTFTGTGQPYFLYAGGLAPDATSPARRWEWKMPSSVGTFAFTLFVSTPVVPAIVFEMAPGGNRDIYRMGIDGNDVKKLSTSLLTDAQPTVSQGTVVFTSYRDGNAELYSVPLKGGTETRLTSTTTVNETNASLSPNATRLAWAQGPVGGITKIFYGKANTDSSAAANPGSGDAIESSPNWSGETRLAFTSAAGGSADIYSVNVPTLKTGGTGTLLTGGSTADVEAAWDPAGTRVAFASNRSGDTDLYLYTVATGLVSRLTTRTGSDGAPTWLKDGRIVYTCVAGTTFRLCILDPASPAGASVITTPFPADHASGVRY